MLYQNTLSEIGNNINTGVEYEIALFYKLLPDKGEKDAVMSAIELRADIAKVLSIIEQTDTTQVLEQLKCRGLTLLDVSFETQNDEVGPSDIVMYVRDDHGNNLPIGLSVKYANKCTKNITGRKFITDQQKDILWAKYETLYFPQYREYMISNYGNAVNWHRKTSPITDAFIDEIRDAVIANWFNIEDKTSLLVGLFHAESPVEFWVVEYNKRGYKLRTIPQTIDARRANDVIIKKYKTSYVAFYLDDVIVGRMQVKFNNGFIESIYNHKGERKKITADFVQDGIEFIYGKPFGSWNFSVEK